MRLTKRVLIGAGCGAVFGALVLGLDSLTETDSVLSKISGAVQWPVVAVITPRMTGDRDTDYRLWVILVICYWTLLSSLGVLGWTFIAAWRRRLQAERS
jgi:hypothetical protein